jgi:hypothetical protein
MPALPAAVATTAVAPEQAAGSALMQCVAHAGGMTAITRDNAAALARNGLEYQATAPDALKAMAATPYGTGSFARSPSREGDVWAVGYDRGACIVIATGTAVEPVEQRLAAMFAIPGGWHPEPIPQRDAGARWTQYGWDMNRRHLTAQMKVQPLPGTPVKGVVMVTIRPEQEKK